MLVPNQQHTRLVSRHPPNSVRTSSSATSWRKPVLLVWVCCFVLSRSVVIGMEILNHRSHAGAHEWHLARSSCDSSLRLLMAFLGSGMPTWFLTPRSRKTPQGHRLTLRRPRTRNSLRHCGQQWPYPDSSCRVRSRWNRCRKRRLEPSPLPIRPCPYVGRLLLCVPTLRRYPLLGATERFAFDCSTSPTSARAARIPKCACLLPRGGLRVVSAVTF